jgi:hypothetical protein
LARCTRASTPPCGPPCSPPPLPSPWPSSREHDRRPAFDSSALGSIQQLLAACCAVMRWYAIARYSTLGSATTHIRRCHEEQLHSTAVGIASSRFPRAALPCVLCCHPIQLPDPAPRPSVCTGTCLP